VGSERQSIRIFLSHRYRSSAANLALFSAFGDLATVQFEVDAGSFPTNVTRLERAIRRANAFVGIYPLDVPPDRAPTPDELQQASRYFRLELDLAARSRKLALVFFDRRFGSRLRIGGGAFVPFDTAELTVEGAPPQLEECRAAFARFCELVAARRHYEQVRVRRFRTSVAVLLPREGDYAGGVADDVVALLGEAGLEDVITLPWPVVVDRRFHEMVETVEWALLDVGAPESAAIAGFLHGRFVPTMRVARGEAPLEGGAAPLFTAIEAGYPTDIVRWSERSELLARLGERLESLNAGTRLIRDQTEALAYFRGAALRSERVFLIYSGEDAEEGKAIQGALGRRFERVFDYRDGRSIPPGSRWQEQIFAQLQECRLAVILLSPTYVESGYCMHEAREISSLADAGKLVVRPVKLRQGDLELPPFLRDIQYARAWEHDSVEAMVEQLLAGTEWAPAPGA
jgi:hypothetical protein